MAENIQRSRGRPEGYKFDRGGMAAEMGPFIGIVVNNVDNTRSGRLQVYIEEFGATNADGSPNLKDTSLWRTVSYCPPFYGSTPINNSSSADVGKYPGNQNSYGMWFTPPDIGVSVLCFFVAGDPTQGYYLGCIPNQGANHMIPAIGSTPNYEAQNKNQETYFSGAKRLPVTEINTKNEKIENNPKFFDQKKPVHSYVAGVLFQQGLANDPIRGSIASSSQRESPSSCYGISTPGRAIYQGGATDTTVANKIKSGDTPLSDVQVIGRRGGHSFVMDDGDLEGNDNLIRIRTSKGHQITMSDDGNCFYITHANGQTWIELGQEGTVDVFSTNSVNVRTEGTINLHADKDINMYAGNNINMKSKVNTAIQADGELSLGSKQDLTLFASSKLGLKSGGQLALKATSASFDGGSSLSLKGSTLNLNGGPSLSVKTVKGITKYVQPDVKFNSSSGWQVSPTGLESIVTRAPTHEPYPYHNQGVSVSVALEKGQSTPPPSAPPVPKGVSITKTSDTSSSTSTTTSASAQTSTSTTSNASSPTNVSNPPTTPEDGKIAALKVELGRLGAQLQAIPIVPLEQGTPEWQARKDLRESLKSQMSAIQQQILDLGGSLPGV